MRSLCTLVATTIAIASTAHAADQPRLLLTSPAKQARYAGFLPKTTDPWLEGLRSQFAYYDSEAMPPAYQHEGGVHAPSYNISAAKPQERFGNANVEFPWGEPGGVMPDSNAKSVKFVRFPERLRIRYWTNAAGAIEWVYPCGTVFGEILTVTDGSSYDHPFEIRIRHLDDNATWRFEVYRPFATSDELAAAIRALGQPWNGGTLARTSISDRATHPGSPAFEATAVEEHLPALPDRTVQQLLQRPFKPVANTTWIRDEKGNPGYAPTTAAAFHIVPRGYNGSHIAPTAKGCMQCHNSALRHANEFDGRRDWYGHVRGSHRIFSFHIFEPSCIAHNGYRQPIAYNAALIQAGLLVSAN